MKLVNHTLGKKFVSRVFEAEIITSLFWQVKITCKLQVKYPFDKLLHFSPIMQVYSSEIRKD